MVKWIVAGGVIFMAATYAVGIHKIHSHNHSFLIEMGDSQAEFEALFKAIEKQTGYRVLVTSGYRSYEEQVRLKKQNSKNAAPGRSPHQYKRAMDINLISFSGLIRKSDTKARWNSTGVPQLAKERGFRWGGDFNTYHDPVHFELRSE